MDFDLIRGNTQIRETLRKRFHELNVSYSKVAKDAKALGVSGINRSSVCKYFRSETKGTITHEQIIWLCVRYGIEVKVKVASLSYKEEDCLKKISLIFG